MRLTSHHISGYVFNMILLWEIHSDKANQRLYTKRKLEHEHLLQVIYAYVWELHFLVLSLISLLSSHRGTTGLHTLRSSIYKWLYWGFCMWPPEHVFCFEVVHYEVLMHPEYLKKKSKDGWMTAILMTFYLHFSLSETRNFIEPKLYMNNHWMVPYKIKHWTLMVIHHVVFCL